VTAGAFLPEFAARAEADGHSVIAWTLDDIYRAGARTGHAPTGNARRSRRGRQS
jgi:hypothetical protein